MNIRKLFDRKDELEDEIIDINHEVKERWEKLLGFGCGYFDDWSLHKDTVHVGYEHRGSHGTDEIPVRFFEMDDADESKKEYSAYISKKKEEDAAEKLRIKKQANLELYHKLKEEYEG